MYFCFGAGSFILQHPKFSEDPTSVQNFVSKERQPLLLLVNFVCTMRKYRLVAKKGEGTFSEVLKAQNVKDGRYHAIKCMKNRFESIDQVKYRFLFFMPF